MSSLRQRLLRQITDTGPGRQVLRRLGVGEETGQAMARDILAKEPTPDRLQKLAHLGEVWEIQRNYFKLTPSCRYTHPPLGALEEIRDDIDPDTIDSIDVYSYRNATDLDHTNPSTFTSAKFSIPYVVARSILVGDLWLEDFSEIALADDRTRALAERVTVHLDPAFEATFPDHWSARLEVTHRDGRTVSAECIDPPGDFRRHPDRDTLESLCFDLLTHRFDEAQAANALEALLDIRTGDVRSVGATLRMDDDS